MGAQKGLPGSPSTIGQDELRTLIEQALPGTGPQTSQFLAETARIRSARTEETIFRQDGPIPLTLVIRGYGAFRRTTVDGRQLTVGIANPGDLFGFASIASTHSSVDLVALTDGNAAVWKGSEVRRLAASDPGFALDVIDRMAFSLNTITEKLDGYLHQDARRRVVRPRPASGSLLRRASDPVPLPSARPRRDKSRDDRPRPSRAGERGDGR